MATPRGPQGQPGAPERTVPVSTTMRVVLLLLALWTAYFGLTLILFQDAGAASLGGDSKDEAARRLLGIHVLALAPVYALLGWNPRRYGVLIWLPYLTQAGIAVALLFDLAADNIDPGDALLAIIVSIIFLVLLVYLWQAGRRPMRERRAPVAPSPASPPPSTGPPGEQ